MFSLLWVARKSQLLVGAEKGLCMLKKSGTMPLACIYMYILHIHVHVCITVMQPVVLIIEHPLFTAMACGWVDIDMRICHVPRGEVTQYMYV